MITRYMLGDLSERESAQLEDSSFSNPEQLEELRSVENDLIDEYARGEMTPGERAKFEQLFLANPARRPRVEFARALAGVAQHHVSSSIIKRGENRTFGSFIASLLRPQRPVLVYGAAAVLLTMLVGSWWLLTRSNLRTEQVVTQQPSGGDQAKPENLTTPASPGTEPNQGPKLASSLPPNGDTRTENGRKLGASTSPARPTVATFVLLPGLARSEGERTKLVIPRDRQSISLKLILAEADAKRYRSFTAVLSSATSRNDSTANSLSIRRDGSVILNIPVSRLPAKTTNYDLTLRGRSAGGAAFDTLGYYYLTFIRQ